MCSGGVGMSKDTCYNVRLGVALFLNQESTQRIMTRLRVGGDRVDLKMMEARG